MVVTTPLRAVFSLAKSDLTVTVRGPVTRTQTMKGVPTATPKSFVFDQMPAGRYMIRAQYGQKETAKTANVSGNTYELQLTFR